MLLTVGTTYQDTNVTPYPPNGGGEGPTNHHYSGGEHGGDAPGVRRGNQPCRGSAGLYCPSRLSSTLAATERGDQFPEPKLQGARGRERRDNKKHVTKVRREKVGHIHLAIRSER